jgi:hypothetical protein
LFLDFGRFEIVSGDETHAKRTSSGRFPGGFNFGKIRPFSGKIPYVCGDPHPRDRRKLAIWIQRAIMLVILPEV